MGRVIHPELGIVECVRSIRSRSIRLAVLGDGILRLSYPLFTSQRTALAFAERKRAWIESTRRRIMERQANYPTMTRSEVETLRRRAKRELPTAVERLAAEHALSYTSLRISSAHTRWGSCSAKNGLSLSLFVMLLPDELRDFIILHELCHTRHHNHSEAFHALLDRCVGGREREYNRRMKEYRIPRIVE